MTEGNKDRRRRRYTISIRIKQKTNDMRREYWREAARVTSAPWCGETQRPVIPQYSRAAQRRVLYRPSIFFFFFASSSFCSHCKKKPVARKKTDGSSRQLWAGRPRGARARPSHTDGLRCGLVDLRTYILMMAIARLSFSNKRKQVFSLMMRHGDTRWIQFAPVRSWDDVHQQYTTHGLYCPGINFTGKKR